MAADFELTLPAGFLQALSEADKKMQNLMNSNSQLTKSTVNAYLQMTNEGVNPYIKSLEQQRMAMNAISKVRLGKNASSEMVSLKRQASEYVKEIDKVIKAVSQINEKGAIKAYDKMYSPKGNTSISNMARVLQLLQDAQLRINRNTDAGKVKFAEMGERIKRVQADLNQATGASQRFAGSHRELLNVSDQLQRKLALVFSVSQIQGYVQKMVEVRGEFELQQRALQAILQSKDDADKIWQQTVDLAVRSPFRVGELVKYTKQLAAYRIENDKLHDTTKRLADVSAGLGVDMNRIILAFGQVRAAAYLRGTELRQFTEAGIPMLEELARHFSELEGKSVSVGEVFGRISKRMVAFKDVEAVFKRMTDAGGVFYNMQEIQAETLKGKISNLKDSIDLMMNEIGKINAGTINDVIDSLKGFVDNWETAAIVLQQLLVLVSTISFAKLVKGLTLTKAALINTAMAGNGFVSTGAKIKTTLISITKWLKTHPWIALAGAIASIIYTLYKLNEAANKTKIALEELQTQGAFDASMSIQEYKRLADTVRDQNKTYKEQKEALDTLQKKFKDIVPDHLLELQNIKNSAEGYDKATQAIRAYIAEKTREKQLQRVESDYGEKVQQTSTTLNKALRAQITKLTGANVTKTQVQPIIDELESAFERGEVNATNYEKKLQELIKAHTGLNIEVKKFSYSMQDANGKVITETFNILSEETENFLSSITQVKYAIQDLNATPIKFGSFMPTPELNNIQDKINNIKTQFGELLDVVRGSKKGDPLIDSAERDLSELDALFKEYTGKEAPKWNEIINDSFRLNQATIDFNIGLWKNYIKKVESIKLPENLEGARTNFIEKLTKEMNDFSGEKFEKEINRIMISLADKFKVTTEGLEAFFYDSSKGMTAYADEAVKKFESIKENLKDYEHAQKYKVALSPITDEEYNRLKSQMPLLEAFIEIIKGFVTPKKPTGGNKRDWLGERIKAIRDAHKAYKDLRKDFDKETAQATVNDSYADLFTELKMNINDVDFTKPLGVVRALEQLGKTGNLTSKEMAKLKKAIAEVQLTIDQDDARKASERFARDLENLFGNYEMSLELEKLNIPPDFAKNLFGIESIDLTGLRNSILDKKGLGNLSKLDNEMIYESEAFKKLKEDEQKTLKEYLEKTDKAETKAQEERLKKYLKYSEKQMSERAKVKFKEMKMLDEIEKTFKIEDTDTEEQKSAKIAAKQAALVGVAKEAKEELAKLEWQSFKQSDVFASMYQDLDKVSSSALKNMIDQLNKYKNEWTDLPINEMKEVIALMEKLKQNQMEREAQANPFKGIGLMGKLKDSTQDQIDFADAEANLAYYQKQIDELDIINQLLLQGKLTQEDITKYNEKYGITITSNSKDIAGVTNDIKQQKQHIQGVVKEEKKRKQTAQDNLAAAEKQRKQLEAQEKALGDGLKMANDLYDAFKGLYEVLGGDEDSPVAIFTEMGMNMANTIVQTMQLQIQLNLAAQSAQGFGAAMNTAMGVVGWIVMGVQLITQALSAIIQAHDKALENTIQDNLEYVEKLQRAYEKLEKQIEDAYSVGAIQTSYDLAKRNMNQQLRATQNMIEMEEKKKKKDEDRIKDWKNEIEDMNEQLRELEEQRLEDLGGLGSDANYKSAAEDFTEAWFDAYREVGDGIGGLEDTFNEFLDNVVKKQLLMRGTNKLLEPVLRMIDQAIDDGMVTTREMAEINEKWNNDTKDALNSYYQSIYQMYEGMITGAGELSELSRGIQNITEPQAAAIEAYLNSMRFFVSDSNRVLKEIQQQMTVGTNNPMVSELKAQTQLIRTIDENLSSVIGKGSSSHTGAYLKVLVK